MNSPSEMSTMVHQQIRGTASSLSISHGSLAVESDTAYGFFLGPRWRALSRERRPNMGSFSSDIEPNSTNIEIRSNGGEKGVEKNNRRELSTKLESRNDAEEKGSRQQQRA